MTTLFFNFKRIVMSTINIPLSRYISRKMKRLWNLPLLAKKLNLMVSNQQNLGNQLIGLDAVKRKLLLLRKEKDKFDYCVVDLQNVQHCSVKKVYGSIRAGDLQTKGLHHYLQSVSLRLGLKNGAESIDVNFFESKYNTAKQQSFLESAAKKWEQAVLSLLPKTVALTPA